MGLAAAKDARAGCRLATVTRVTTTPQGASDDRRRDTPVDADERARFARLFTDFVEVMESTASVRVRTSPAAEHVAAFLGAPADEVEPVVESFLAHQVVDVDLAVESLLTELDGARHGVVAQHRMHVDSFAELLTSLHSPARLGPVSYARQRTGPDSDRRVVTFGMAELRLDGVPLVLLQRAPARHHGRELYTLELLSPDGATADRFLSLVHERMAELSTLRGQVISFAPDPFDHDGSGGDLRFLRRPAVGADQVVLPDGVLERITRHVVDIGTRREALTAAGQHLKRGVLLYGPPGTGKTHLVRHLLTLTPGTTAVLLSGNTLHLLGVAAKLASANQPAMVVLEDCDLIAESRGGDSGGALFEMLEAMDGLSGDADVTFLLTTNRVDLLERALVERPGRVDLAVEVERPDLEGRRRLFELYAADLLASGTVGAGTAAAVAERTEGVTASFTKELVRRSVVDALDEGRTVGDADVLGALDEMLSDAEHLTRRLLGGGPGVVWQPDDEGDLVPAVLGTAGGAYASSLEIVEDD